MFEIFKSVDVFVILVFMVLLIISFWHNLSQLDEIRKLREQKIDMLKRNLEVLDKIEEVEQELLEYDRDWET